MPLEFTKEAINEIGSIPMNFVLGKERSGTTLLQLMLNAHPNIIAPPESRFIILQYYRYGKVDKWTEKIINSFCNDLFSEGWFRNFWDINREELQAIMISHSQSLTFPLVCKLIFRLSSEQKENVLLFFDKNPVYYYFLPVLARIFPESKYIHLVRDYRANLVSHSRVFTLKNPEDIAYRWVKVNKLIEDAKRYSPQNYFTLTYESLVTKPEQEMKNVCNFLHIAYSENMANAHTSGMSSKFSVNTQEGFRKIHGNVFQPINASLANDWTDKISPAQIGKAEALAGIFAEKQYGYKRHVDDNKFKPGVLSLLSMKLKYTIIKVLYQYAFSHRWLYRVIKRNVWKSF